MTRFSKTWLLLGLLLFLLSIQMVHSTHEVIVDFVYWDPTELYKRCGSCFQEYYDDFIIKSRVIEEIQSEYGDQISVNSWEYYTNLGTADVIAYYYVNYNVSLNVNWYPILIRDDQGNFTVMRELNETLLRGVIDSYLSGEAPPSDSQDIPTMTLLVALGLAFSFGFLETFSPCLLALLSFVLSYTISETSKARQNVLQVMLFGVGFVLAALLLGIAVGVTLIFASPLQTALVIIVCVIAIVFGLNLLGFNLLKLFKIDLETKPLVQKLAKKYVFTYAGLFVLGFLFYFLDPCIAPVFISMMSLLVIEYLPLILFVFALGVIVPFVCIAILAGSISKLVRGTYKHKAKIRAISGLILIIYGLYFVFQYVHAFLF